MNDDPVGCVLEVILAFALVSGFFFLIVLVAHWCLWLAANGWNLLDGVL